MEGENDELIVIEDDFVGFEREMPFDKPWTPLAQGMDYEA